ncbi:beta-galactosidase [Novipirellula herctigrandis]
MTHLKELLLVAVLLIPAWCVNTVRGESLNETARQKIEGLNTRISQADTAGIDTLKEKMTVRTAEVFLKYSDWDEAHKNINTDQFKLVPKYKETASETAEMLADFERQEVIIMLDEATENIDKLIAGTTRRKPIPNIDWSKVSHNGDVLTFENSPVFLTDWTWKPDIAELNEYHGQQDGFFLMHPFILNEDGEISQRILSELKEKPDGRAGFIFLNHKNVPQWAKHNYGPEFSMRDDTYTAYDIDHPGAREMNRLLLSGTVPYMAGKKYSELGYMLCNEPHFYTTKDVWATGPVSEYTLRKFNQWLLERHKNIETLNELWGTHFPSFEEVEITIPISAELQGTPKWHDWVSFNMDRVTDWYQFLKTEIRRHDPSAKVHLKIMPNLWTDNKRNHGIDLEALTRMSDIIGNDAGSAYNTMWGHVQWQDQYALDWREMSMAHDFLKSVSPEKIMFNTESHFLSTGRSRDLRMNPAYARATFWLAHTQGLTVSQNWFWARMEDGSIRRNAGKGFGASNNQQPRIVNEVHSTMMDLNSYAEEIVAMQRQRKPIRIFYSKASAINKPEHMDDVFELYESLFFEGVPLGYVTADILSAEEHSNWDVVLIHKTQYVTPDDLKALQNYVNQGGHVLIDEVSLKMDQYGRPLEGLGNSPRIAQTKSFKDMKSKALRFIGSRGQAPPVVIQEENSAEGKGCTWKCIEMEKGHPVVSIVNVGKTPASLKLSLRNATNETICRNLLSGQIISDTPTLKPYDVLFVEVTDGNVQR